MEQEINLETEYSSIGNSTFLNNPNIFDSLEKDYSLGLLLETMFDVHQDCDYTSTTTSSIFDLLLMPPHEPQPIVNPISPIITSTFQESSNELINIPVTPNLSSISSSSTEATDDNQQINTVNKQHDEDKYKKQLKPIKKNQKKERQPRFAFMTKSEIDHLDDGFRWRKYGQKAVKKSPFPRSYHRCTTTSCGVKKRVERSIQDPSIVVTTYEGTHTHPCPVMPRGYVGVLPRTATYGSTIGGGNSGGSTYYGDSSIFSTNNSLQERRLWNSSSSSSTLVNDDGLLQNMESSQMRRDPIEE
ncbi:probable WRKY transcription factor 48 [Lycium ferocissimum]|uniref:probable WRKY transcription factor 48 n=1 Tax=Lycium ferocissimum TaxID=112874 RepID=UPI00281670C9|nr:probable WRKY transcription factor 48 [Lycium ferocissimum]